MALNETIVSFGTGTANYGTLVGQSLAQLGQQVGQQLANQEYQKQAAAQLPFITQQMQIATREASEGKFGDAYSKIIGLTANPQVTNNPYILPALEMGMQAIKQGSSQAWYNIQRGGGGTTATGIPAVSGVAQARQRMGMGGVEMPMQPQPPTDVTRDAIDAEAAANLPQDQGQVDFTTPTPEANVDAGMEAQYQGMDLSAAQNAQLIATSAPEQRPDIIGTNIAYTQGVDKSKYKKIIVPGLKRFYGTDEIFVPPIDTAITVSTQAKTNEGGFKEDLKEVLIGQDDYEKSVSEARNLSSYISTIKGQKPEGSDKTLEKLINQAGGITGITLRPSSVDPQNFPMEMIFSETEAPVLLNKDQSVAVATIYGLSANAPAKGWVFGEGAAGPTMAAKTFGTMQEAMASGLPEGSTVYIGGKRRVLGGQPMTQPSGSPMPTNLLDMFPQR